MAPFLPSFGCFRPVTSPPWPSAASSVQVSDALWVLQEAVCAWFLALRTAAGKMLVSSHTCWSSVSSHTCWCLKPSQSPPAWGSEARARTVGWVCLLKYHFRNEGEKEKDSSRVLSSPASWANSWGRGAESRSEEEKLPRDWNEYAPMSSETCWFLGRR